MLCDSFRSELLRPHLPSRQSHTQWLLLPPESLLAGEGQAKGGFCLSRPHKIVIWGKGDSVEKVPPSDWSRGKPVGTCSGLSIDMGWPRPTNGGATPEQVVPGYRTELTEEAMGRRAFFHDFCFSCCLQEMPQSPLHDRL